MKISDLRAQLSRNFSQQDAQLSQLQAPQETEKDFESIKNSIPGFFLSNPKFAWLFFAGICLLGIISILTIRINDSPEIESSLVQINIAYPGASPSDIENLLTEKIENAVSSVSDIKNITSTVGFGVSNTNIEFLDGVEISKKVTDIKSEIDKIKSDFPEDATDPNVIEFNFSDQPKMIMSLLGKYNQKELYEFADEVSTALDSIPAVSKVSISGGQKRAFDVFVNTQNLELYGLNVTDVLSAIKSQNINVPLGNFLSDEYYYAVRVQEEVSGVEDILDLPIKTVNGATIFVKDVAQVYDSGEKIYGNSRVGLQGKEIRESVTLQIFKKKNDNILTFSDSVRTKMDELKKNGVLPQDIEYFISRDIADNTRRDLGNLLQNFFFTLILVGLTLLLIGVYESIITMLSIPLTMCLSLFVLSALGYTVNNITLFALILSLGLLVDSATIVVEGCHDYVNKGYKGLQAALLTIKEYKGSLISGTLTTIAAFLTLLSVTGPSGQFIRVIPITITIVLISALFLALTFNLLLASFILKPSAEKTAKEKNRLNAWQYKWYETFLRMLLKNRASRIITIMIGIIFFLFVMIFIRPLVPSEFFPQGNLDFMSISIEAPKDAQLNIVDTVTKEVEKVLQKNPLIESFSSSVGGASRSMTNKATINITLQKDRPDKDGEKIKLEDISSELDKELTKIQGAIITVEKPNIGPPISRPINIRLLGEKTEEIEKESDAILKLISTVNGVFRPDSSIRYGAGEYTFDIDKELAEKRGLSVGQITQNLRLLVQGDKATTIRKDGTEIRINIGLQDKELTSISDIQNITFTNRIGERVRFDEIATVKLGANISDIKRRNSKKVVEISSQLAPKKPDGTEYYAAEVEAAIKNALRVRCLNGPNSTPPDIKASEYSTWVEKTNQIKQTQKQTEFCTSESIQVQFGGESEQTNDSFGSIFQAMIVSIIIILGIVLLQFNSFSKMFIVFTTIPMGLIGVFFGLLMREGGSLSFPSGMGVAALTGLVVINGILLIEKMDQNVESGMDPKEATIQGAVLRLKPIFITVLNTVIAEVPSFWADDFYAFIAIVVFWGLTISTILALIFVPVLYYMFLPKKYFQS